MSVLQHWQDFFFQLQVQWKCWSWYLAS